MKIIISWLINTVAVTIAAYVMPGVRLDGFWAAFWTAAVLGLVNAVIKPIFIILTLPINILTLGLFTLVINAMMILLVGKLVPGFEIDGFWWAMLFSIVLTIINAILNAMTKE
ncbi:MAG TPA: phage holin family protein [Patescibacteria group bacterium]|nr:phage holin family protein [Patescibacteria group bacterium]